MSEREPAKEHLREVQRKNEQILFRKLPGIRQSETQRPKQIIEIRSGKTGRQETYSYGPDGAVSARTEFGRDGSRIGKDIFVYDPNDNLIKLDHRRERKGRDITTSVEEFSYDPDGRLVQAVSLSRKELDTPRESLAAKLYRYEGEVAIQSQRDRQGETKDTDRFIFTDGNMVRWEILDDRGEASESWDFIYDERGRMMSETHEIVKSGYKGTWEYQRDETGNIIKATHRDSNGKETSGYDVEIQYENK